MAKKLIALVAADNAAGLGLVRAISEDTGGEHRARAMVRNIDGPESRLLRSLGAEVFAGDPGNDASLKRLFQGAHGAFYIQLSSDHPSLAKKVTAAKAMGRAAKAAGLRHLIWATLEDPRQTFLEHNDVTPTFKDGRWISDHPEGETPHQVLKDLAVPTTFLETTWEPTVEAGTWTEGIGKHAFAVLRSGDSVGKTVSISAASLDSGLKTTSETPLAIVTAPAPAPAATPATTAASTRTTAPAIPTVPAGATTPATPTAPVRTTAPAIPIAPARTTAPAIATAPARTTAPAAAAPALPASGTGSRPRRLWIAGAIVAAVALGGVVLARQLGGHRSDSDSRPQTAALVAPPASAHPTVVAVNDVEISVNSRPTAMKHEVGEPAEKPKAAPPDDPMIAPAGPEIAAAAPRETTLPSAKQRRSAPVRLAVAAPAVARPSVQAAAPGPAATAAAPVEAPAPAQQAQAPKAEPAPAHEEPARPPTPTAPPPIAAGVRPTARTPEAKPAVVSQPAGYVDPKAVAAAVRAHATEARACYERAVMERPDLHGRLIFRAAIDPTGRVLSISPTRDVEGGSRLEGCLVAAFKTWLFPSPVGGVNGNITYSFTFESDTGQ